MSSDRRLEFRSVDQSLSELWPPSPLAVASPAVGLHHLDVLLAGALHDVLGPLLLQPLLLGLQVLLCQDELALLQLRLGEVQPGENGQRMINRGRQTGMPRRLPSLENTGRRKECQLPRIHR